MAAMLEAGSFAPGGVLRVCAAAAHDDQADIQASLEGDEHAYGRLVQRYESLVATQMWRFSRDPLIVDELVQDVFVEAYQSLRGYRGDAPFLHWLRRIATRVGYRHWKHKRREETRRAALTLAPPPEPEDTTPSEAGEFLHTLFERLDTKDRLVLTLLYFEDLSTHEIAERTGWSRSLVKVRAHRARKKLRAMLEEAGYESA